MPIKHGYEVALLKKEVAMAQAYWPRISSALALRLRNAFLGRTFSPFRVLDEISYLEQLPTSRRTSTKPPEAFKGPILGRFMHKHYSTSAHLVTNLLNQWTGPYAEKHDLLIKQIEEVIPEGRVVETDEEARQLAGRLAHRVVMDGYRRRTSRQAMTGEWIVYYVNNGQNYYLDLAWHSEQSDEQKLYDRLERACAWEFPFAFK